MLPSDVVVSPQRARLVLWLRQWWAVVVLVVIGLGYSGAVTMMHSKALSPIDEWVYSDYLDKVPTQILVRSGEPIGHEALDRIACDGVFPYGVMGGPCGHSYEPSTFPFGGLTSADNYSPAYFMFTWACGAVIRLFTGVPELTAWRLTGPLWLALTLVALGALLRSYDVPNLVITALGSAFIVSPFSWWTYTFISTDAPAVFFGALIMLFAARRARGRGGTGWLLSVSALAVLFKVTNILGVGLAGLLLVLSCARSMLLSWRKGDRAGLSNDVKTPVGLALTGMGAVAVGVLTEWVWLVIHSAMSTNAAPLQIPSEDLSRNALGIQFTNFLPNILTANVQVTGGGGIPALPISDWAVAPLSWICVAGVLGAFWLRAARGDHGALIISTAVASVTFAPLLAIALKTATHSYFWLPPRYGASILPAILLVTALMIRNHFAAVLILAYAAVLGSWLIRLTFLLASS